MTPSVSLQDAQANLRSLIRGLGVGEEVIITEQSKPIAALRAVVESSARPKFGSCRGMLTIVSDDDEHLKDFADYMP